MDEIEKIDFFGDIEEPNPKKEGKVGWLGKLKNKVSEYTTGGGSSGKSQDIKKSKSGSGSKDFNDGDDIVKIQEALKKSTKEVKEPKDSEEIESTTEKLQTTENINPIMKKKTLTESLSQPVNNSNTQPKNAIVSQSFGSLSNSVYDMIYQTKPIEKIIFDMYESLQMIPATKYDEVIDMYAEQLAYATDKEGNKLFSSVSEAKKFIDGLRSKKRLKYTLPKAITKEIKEKEQKKLTPMIKRELNEVHHNRVMYQF